MTAIDEIKAHSIDMNGMNAKLKDLYLKMLAKNGDNWYEYNASRKDEQHDRYITNPYLLAVSNEYQSNKPRIMIVGQENLTWGGIEFGGGGAFDRKTHVENLDDSQYEDLIEDLMKLYDKKVNQKLIDSSSFWRFGWAIEDQTKCPVVYTNVAKLGWCSRKGFAARFQPRILTDEIAITEPDFIVFATGPQNKYMKELEKNGVVHTDGNVLWESEGYVYAREWIMKVNNSSIRAFWCCHPYCLTLNKTFDPVVERIARAIEIIKRPNISQK